MAEPYRLVPTAKRIRARIGGTFIADSTRAALLVPGDGPPRTYVFPPEDVRMDLATGGGRAEDEKPYGRVRLLDLKVDGRTIEGALRTHEAPQGNPVLADRVAVVWGQADAWYEEEEEVFVHPRDPYHRIDVLRSRRHVVIAVDDTVIAESHQPVLLFETGLPVRTYLPHDDVRLDLLQDSDTETGCPYKGTATYHHVALDGKVHRDLVWTYRAPFEGVQKIQGLLAFYDERVEVTVDGTRQERPRTMWSPR